MLSGRKGQCSYKAGNQGADEETNTDRAGLQTSQSSQDDNCAASLNVTDCKKRHFIKLRFIRFHSSQRIKLRTPTLKFQNYKAIGMMPT